MSIKRQLTVFAVAATACLSISAYASEKPTVLLVHGAFADSSSWNGVAANLSAKGYPVVSVANPLRGVRNDADYATSVLKSIKGPVVLVGHSYGGTVITNMDVSGSDVKALVYVGAFAPDTGESVVDLAGKYPGSTLGPSLAAPIMLAGGGKDFTIDQSKFRAQFAADVPVKTTKLMAATQRPITEAAILEAAGAPTWKNIPSWAIYGMLDQNIPAAAMNFMAKRAGAKSIVEIKSGSHVVQISHPDKVAKIIEAAATAK